MTISGAGLAYRVFPTPDDFPVGGCIFVLSTVLHTPRAHLLGLTNEHRQPFAFNCWASRV